MFILLVTISKVDIFTCVFRKSDSSLYNKSQKNINFAV